MLHSIMVSYSKTADDAYMAELLTETKNEFSTILESKFDFRQVNLVR
jgi:hypothetical protein